MITFNFETEVTLVDEAKLASWVTLVVEKEGFELGEINYVFCDDAYLLPLNIEFLNHDTLTDIISFDTTMGKLVSGDIFISIERVTENAKIFEVDFLTELHRVMIHGVLHYLGYKDKSEAEQQLMRSKENEALTILSH